MIEQVECLGAKLDGLAFDDYESAVQRGIHNRVTGTGKNVAPGITEGEWRGIGERSMVA